MRGNIDIQIKILILRNFFKKEFYFWEREMHIGNNYFGANKGLNRGRNI